MTKLSVSDSFIVRIYRIDTESPKKLTGLVEMMDGTGDRAPFTDLDELAAILNRGVAGWNGWGKPSELKPKSKAWRKTTEFQSESDEWRQTMESELDTDLFKDDKRGREQ